MSLEIGKIYRFCSEKEKSDIIYEVRYIKSNHYYVKLLVATGDGSDHLVYKHTDDENGFIPVGIYSLLADESF